MTKKQNLLDTFIQDKHGKVVLWQTPNGLLLLWAFAEVLNGFIARGMFQKLCSTVAFGAIFAWSWLEITTGASYARRALGVCILIISVYSKIR